jgi:hypothetical protein
MKTAKDMSVAELEHLLNSKKAQLESLRQRREKLAQELASVEQQINSTVGVGRQASAAPAAPAAAARKTGKRRVLRAKNDRSLKSVVVELLTNERKGLGLDELSRKVLETGYKTSSTKFKNTLYQCLYHADNIALDKKNGLYHLV